MPDVDLEGLLILRISHDMARLDECARDRVARWTVQRYVVDAEHQRRAETETVLVMPMPKLVQ